jgi:hypothetical protein
MFNVSVRNPVKIVPVREGRMILINDFSSIVFFFLDETALCKIFRIHLVDSLKAKSLTPPKQLQALFKAFERLSGSGLPVGC